jgi:hypothetical protein
MTTSAEAEQLTAFFGKLLSPEASGRHFCGSHKPPGGKWRDEFVGTHAELAELVLRRNAEGADTYMALAAFGDRAKGRKQSNVVAVSSRWLDIDLKEKDGTVNYESVEAAVAAVKAFAAKVGLPKPLIVFSGRNGIHCYWSFSPAASHAGWLPYARELKRLCGVHGLRADPSRTADAASVLRPIGTTNRKATS